MTRSVPEWVAAHDDQAIPKRVRMRVFERFGGVCQISHRKIGPADRWECDHIRALVNGGEHRESNLQPVLTQPHREKTAEDVAQKKKDNRVRQKHFGQWPKKPFPGGKGDKFKRKVDGTTVLRDGD